MRREFVVPRHGGRAPVRISAAHSGGHVVAITGSRGKTTLKEWIFQLMEPLAEVIRSPRSYNSQIGVPLSLWEIEPSTDLAVIETGVSQRGEMRRLADIIRPDTVILTNILANHDAGFASRQEKSDEKRPCIRRISEDPDIQCRRPSHFPIRVALCKRQTGGFVVG